jgi:predicted ester cyclase
VKLILVTVVFAVLYFPAAVAQSAGQAPSTPAPSGQTPGSTAQPSSAEEKQPPEVVARKYAELWNTGNFDVIGSIFKFPAMMSSRGQITRLDANQLRRVITAWHRSMPDLNIKVEDTLVQGEKVAMRLTFTGTYKERLFASTADPKDVSRNVRATAMWMFDIRDGRITRVWEEYDEIRMHYEMGGFWRSNEELEAAAKADRKPATRKSAPVPAPSQTPPSKP